MNNKPEKLAQIFHFDLYGKRQDKYDFLNEKSLADIAWNELEPSEPNYFFVPKNEEHKAEYEKGFSLVELFPVNSVGIVTARDEFTIHNSKQALENTIKEFLSLDDEAARTKFNLGKDVRDWQVNFARKDLQNHYPNKGSFAKVSYRPFDERWTFYTGKSKGFHCYPRNEVMQHFLKGENVGLVVGRQGQVVGSMTWNLSFIVNSISDLNLYYRGGGQIFPLYLYPESAGKIDFPSASSVTVSANRVPNLKMEIVNEIKKEIGEFEPIDLLDYIYAVLHSPNYREKYKEFLKIDFPRVPYPPDKTTFWQLVKYGSELRQIHLLETTPKLITQYPIDGKNVVEKITFISTSLNEQFGKIFINDTQYFDNVPSVAWNFYIGGYQPAQKWLKDRKDSSLNYDDILHYQKIIVALVETDKIMGEIFTCEK